MIARGIMPRSLIQATPNSTARYAALIRIIWVRLKLIGIFLALQDEGHDDQNQPEQIRAIPGASGVDPPIHDGRGEQINPHYQEQDQAIDVHPGLSLLCACPKTCGDGNGWVRHCKWHHCSCASGNVSVRGISDASQWAMPQFSTSRGVASLSSITGVCPSARNARSNSGVA